MHRMATAPTVQPESLPRELFGLTVKHAAIVFAFIYAIGFLVLSIHHAGFGIETTEPFKPKVFSAGVLFAVLAGVPCVAMARLLEMFGHRMPRTQVVEGEGTAYIGLHRILDFWGIAVGLRIGSAILFEPVELFPKYPGWLFYIICCAIWTTAFIWFTDLNRWPVRTVVIKFTFTASVAAIVVRYNSHDFFLQAVWFYLVGLIFLWVRSVRNRGIAITWERQGFAVVGMVALFVVLVYGHIKSAYGGGAPIRIDMSFTRPTLFSVNKTEGGFLVEQDSQGYYVVHKAQDTETHFIPRDAVGEIVFHGD